MIWRGSASSPSRSVPKIIGAVNAIHIFSGFSSAGNQRHETVRCLNDDCLIDKTVPETRVPGQYDRSALDRLKSSLTDQPAAHIELHPDSVARLPISA